MNINKWQKPNQIRNLESHLYHIRTYVILDPYEPMGFYSNINRGNLCRIKWSEEPGRLNIFDYSTGEDLGLFGVNTHWLDCKRFQFKVESVSTEIYKLKKPLLVRVFNNIFKIKQKFPPKSKLKN